MSDALSFAEIASQHVELLPARTVLSMFACDTNSGNIASDPTSGIVKTVTGLISPSTPGAPGDSGDSGASSS